MNMQLQGLDNFDWGKIATGLTDVVKQATPVVLAAKQQKDLQKLNVERAKQGLAPLDTAAYAEASAPVMKIQGGLDAGNRKLLLWGGLAAVTVLGFALYFGLRPRRQYRRS